MAEKTETPNQVLRLEPRKENKINMIGNQLSLRLVSEV
jgi:hypothetical protein